MLEAISEFTKNVRKPKDCKKHHIFIKYIINYTGDFTLGSNSSITVVHKTNEKS